MFKSLGSSPFGLFALFIALIFSSNVGAAEYKRLSLQNLTGSMVNCPKIQLVVKVDSGSTKSGNRPNKSFRPGETKTFRLGDSTGCQKFSVRLTCVSLLDGWPRELSAESNECRDIYAYFQINEKGELVMSTRP